MLFLTRQVFMLTHHRRPVCLSLISTDLPILSTLETAATLYQKDLHRFHLLLHQEQEQVPNGDQQVLPSSQLLWLELSPRRIVLTRQGNSQFSYRHFWEQGVYGISRYWLNEQERHLSDSFQLRNYTRDITLQGSPLPEFLRVEYELWAAQECLGHYVLHLEIYH
ncbi:hypothetical protein NON20_20605 [Synechocystis sp. B12]|nr:MULTISPECIES: hypothetical protein [unclassified Synechocystis]WLT37983.1 hypothetical protein NON20_20605 [Synechocystis sp. B12]BAM54796.1 hypothetical protein BEST7613_5865 [Synechocystis sp. PCC 6803] [Bacillus subtilis BEST7613]